MILTASYQRSNSAIRNCDWNFLRAARCEVCESLLTHLRFCQHTWQTEFHNVPKIVAEGCHYEQKGWFLLQASNGASMQHMMLI